MPRNGSNVYSKPAGTTAVSGQTIESSKFNEVIDDLVVDANNPRPVEVGGTGASSASGARAALGAVGVSDEQTLTNKTFGDGFEVGATAPFIDFHETDATAGFAKTRIGNDAGVFEIKTRDSSGALVSLDYKITKNASGALTHEWRISDSEVMRIDNNGRVGIGEASPGASLHITSDDPIIRIEDSDTGAYHHLSGNSGGGNFFIDFDRGNYSSSAELFIRRNGAELASFSNSGFQLLGSGSRVNIIRDENDMVSNDPNALVTQQSVKAYNDDTTIGISQTWQDMSGSRASDLTQYQNTTGKPIQVSVMYNGDFNSAYFEVSSNGSSWVRVYADSGDAAPVPMTGVVIPDQHYYRSSTTGGTTDPDWFELR